MLLHDLKKLREADEWHFNGCESTIEEGKKSCINDWLNAQRRFYYTGLDLEIIVELRFKRYYLFESSMSNYAKIEAFYHYYKFGKTYGKHIQGKVWHTITKRYDTEHDYNQKDWHKFFSIVVNKHNQSNTLSFVTAHADNLREIVDCYFADSEMYK